MKRISTYKYQYELQKGDVVNINGYPYEYLGDGVVGGSTPNCNCHSLPNGIDGACGECMDRTKVLVDPNKKDRPDGTVAKQSDLKELTEILKEQDTGIKGDSILPLPGKWVYDGDSILPLPGKWVYDTVGPRLGDGCCGTHGGGAIKIGKVYGQQNE